MIDPDELIATCHKLVPQRASPSPTETDMRRAISTAYYALFHTLAASNAELIAGPPQSDVSAYAWERVYRRLDHGRARNNLRTVISRLSQAGARFARAFIDLQDRRHEADYDPTASVTPSRTLHIIAQAETAVRDFALLSPEERRLLAAQSLFDRR